MNLIGYLLILKKIIINNFTESYIVGGALRDLLSRKELSDIDLVVKSKAGEVAKQFCSKCNGSLVIIDEKRSVFRVYVDELIFDIAKMKGDNIEDDLRMRDFTINAMALNLNELENAVSINFQEFIIDPFSGLSDLKKGVIKAVKNNIFKNDPIRLLRAIRLKAQYGFDIEEKTEDLIRRYKLLLVDTTPERIREELIKIFASNNVASVIKYMEKSLTILSVLFPFIKNKDCIYSNLLNNIMRLEKRLDNLLKDKFWENIFDKDHLPLLKLAVLFYNLGDYGFIVARELANLMTGYRFSNKEVSFIKNLVFYQNKPLYIFLSIEEEYDFFSAAGEKVYYICLLSLASFNNDEIRYKDYHKFIKVLIKKFQLYRSRTEKMLVDGNDIKEIFKLKEGPVIGEMLKKLKRAQATGLIYNRKEAIKYLKKIYYKKFYL